MTSFEKSIRGSLAKRGIIDEDIVKKVIESFEETRLSLPSEYPLTGKLIHKEKEIEVTYKFISEDTIEFVFNREIFITHYKSLVCQK